MNQFVQRIRDVWYPDITYEIMSERLGLTNKRLAAAYHRYPDLKETHPVKPSVISLPVEKRFPNRQYSQRINRIEAIKEAREKEAPYTGPFGEYTLLTLPANGCKWPFGTDASYMTFCGKHQTSGTYCTEHSRLAYMPLETRKVKR